MAAQALFAGDDACSVRHWQQRRCLLSGATAGNMQDDPTPQQVRVDPVHHAGGGHRSSPYLTLPNQFSLELVGVDALAIAAHAQHLPWKLPWGVLSR